MIELITKPVRPNDNKEIDYKSETGDLNEGSLEEVKGDEIFDQIDQIQDHRDDGKIDPGHQKTRFCLKRNQSQSKV